jgi:hypothetical protein
LLPLCSSMLLMLMANLAPNAPLGDHTPARAVGKWQAA